MQDDDDDETTATQLQATLAAYDVLVSLSTILLRWDGYTMVQLIVSLCIRNVNKQKWLK